MTKPVTGLTTWGGQTTGSTADLDDNFAALQDAINDLNTTSNYLLAAGTANAITATLGAGLTGALTDGLIVQLRASNTNTGAATFAYNGGGAVALKNLTLEALRAGDILSGSTFILQYSTSAAAWILQTPVLAPVGSTSPVPTAGAGTFTTVSAALSYTRIADRVLFDVTVTITTNGTASADVRVTLPFTAASNATAVGRETAVGGKELAGTIAAAGNTVIITNYDNTYPGGTGTVLTVSGVFRVA